MTESIPRLRATDPPDAITAQLTEMGAVIVEGLLDADTLARFNAEIDEQMAATPDGRKTMSEAHRGFFGEQTRHITGVAAKSRTFVEEILCHPVLLGACLETIKRHLDVEAAFAAVEAGFADYSKGLVTVPPVGYLSFAKGDCHIKYGYITDDKYFVIKVYQDFTATRRSACCQVLD